MHNRLAAAGQMCSAHHRLCVPPKSRVFRFLLCDSTTKLAWLPHSLRLPKYHLLSKHEFVSKSPGGGKQDWLDSREKVEKVLWLWHFEFTQLKLTALDLRAMKGSATLPKRGSRIRNI